MTPTDELGSGSMFDAIAGRYDSLNRLISLGLDQRWRRRTMEAARIAGDATVLDLATGTGDLALMIARQRPRARVIGVDPSMNMLAVGARKVAAAGLQDRIELRAGDARDLPFDDDTFDAATMAFGIRNVPDRPLALRELARVTRAGGTVAILELSEPRAGVLGAMARLHVHHVVPTVGAFLSGQREYRYLQRSIAAFPPIEEFVALMEENGFSEVAALPLTFGACALFHAAVDP